MCIRPDGSENTLFPIIYERLRVGSIIISDFWRAYNIIQQTGCYNQSTVNNKYNLGNPNNGAHIYTKY